MSEEERNKIIDNFLERFDSNCGLLLKRENYLNEEVKEKLKLKDKINAKNILYKKKKIEDHMKMIEACRSNLEYYKLNYLEYSGCSPPVLKW